MNKDVKTSWLYALRSGKYTQARSALKKSIGHEDDVGYCCLGVLCDISQKGKWKKDRQGTYYWYDDISGVLPKSVKEWSGVILERERDLAGMNDGGSSFEEIADWVETNL